MCPRNPHLRQSRGLLRFGRSACVRDEGRAQCRISTQKDTLPPQAMLDTNQPRTIIVRHVNRTAGRASVMLCRRPEGCANGHWLLYLFFPNTPQGGPPVSWVQARYDCEYVKVGGRWKFSVLKFAAPWPAPPKSG